MRFSILLISLILLLKISGGSHLNRSDHGLMNLPKNIDYTSIDLSNKNIRQLKREDFDHMKSVQNLSLAYNKIKNWQSSLAVTGFSSMKELRYLNLSGNSVSCNDDDSESRNELTSITLIVLDVSNCGLETFNASGMPNLKVLIISNNKLKSLKNIQFPVNIEAIVVSWNSIDNIDSNAFAGLFQLRRLDLSHNKLRKIDKYIIENNTQIETLDLSFNEFQIFEGLISKSLDSLNVSNCQIRELKNYALKLLTNMEYFDISHNNLLYVPKLLNAMSLKEANFNHNKIKKSHPTNWLHLPKLQTILLRDNKLTDWRRMEDFPETVSHIDLAENDFNCNCEEDSYKTCTNYKFFEQKTKHPENLKCRQDNRIISISRACKETIENCDTIEKNSKLSKWDQFFIPICIAISCLVLLLGYYITKKYNLYGHSQMVLRNYYETVANPQENKTLGE